MEVILLMLGSGRSTMRPEPHRSGSKWGRTRSPLATPEKHLCKPVCKSLFPSIPPPAGFPCDLLASQIRELTMTKTKAHPKMGTCFGSGGRTRTCDLVVMSHTSCHCSTPRYCWTIVERFGGKVGSLAHNELLTHDGLPLIYSAILFSLY